MKIGPMNLEIPDCHPFFRIEWTSEILSDGASTRLGPVSHKCKSVGARVFPGRHVYSVTGVLYLVHANCSITTISMN